MKKVLLHGAFFGSNYGDFLFCKILINHLEKYKCNVILGKSSKFFRNKFNIKRNSLEIINLIKSDALVFAPGGYFGEPNVKGLKLLRWRIRYLLKHAYLGVLARLFHKPYAIIGIGAGPLNFWLGRIVTRYIFNGANVITVRDYESYDFIKSLGVKNKNIEICVDLVVHYIKEMMLDNRILNANGFILDNTKKYILFHISTGGDKVSIVSEAIKKYINEKRINCKIIICTDFNLDIEEKLINNVIENFENYDYEVLKYDVDKLSSIISISDLIITFKLHVGIVAAALGKSVISIPVHHKVKRFYNQINESNRCNDNESITVLDVYNMIDEYMTVPIILDNEIYDKSRKNLLVMDDFLESL